MLIYNDMSNWIRSTTVIITIICLLITSAGWAYVKGYQVDQNTLQLEKHKEWMLEHEKNDRVTALMLQKLEIQQIVIKETVIEIKRLIEKEYDNEYK
jgi:hypothetical protein